jgi:hypothetical protein
MISVEQIRSMIEQLTLSKLSLDDFDEWLTRASWNMHVSSSPEAIALVGQIEGGLAVYEAGDISYDAMMQEFGKIGVQAGDLHTSLASKV